MGSVSQLQSTHENNDKPFPPLQRAHTTPFEHSYLSFTRMLRPSFVCVCTSKQPVPSSTPSSATLPMCMMRGLVGKDGRLRVHLEAQAEACSRHITALPSQRNGGKKGLGPVTAVAIAHCRLGPSVRSGLRHAQRRQRDRHKHTNHEVSFRTKWMPSSSCTKYSVHVPIKNDTS